MALRLVLGAGCSYGWGCRGAYHHFLLEVHRGELAEGLDVDGIRNGVQKDFYDVHPARSGFVDGDESGNDHVADHVLPCQRVFGRRGEVWRPGRPKVGRPVGSPIRNKKLYRCFLHIPSHHKCEEEYDVNHSDLVRLWHHRARDKGRNLLRSDEDRRCGSVSLRPCGGAACSGSYTARRTARCPAGWGAAPCCLVPYCGVNLVLF